MWRSIQTGTAVGHWSLDNVNPLLGQQSQKIEFEKGVGEVGIENKGLNRWGMHFEAGKSYEGVLWAKSTRDCSIWMTAEGSDGKSTVAEVSLKVSGHDWQRIEYQIMPATTIERGRLAIRLKDPGSVTLGYVSLQPGAWGRFKNLPVRKDVADKLLEQGVTVMRYGGSMINHPQYRWKNMIGPRDLRQPYQGFWYPYSTNGWGIIDFMSFCEAAGFEYIPAFNMIESPQDMVDFIEYAKGDLILHGEKTR